TRPTPRGTVGSGRTWPATHRSRSCTPSPASSASRSAASTATTTTCPRSGTTLRSRPAPPRSAPASSSPGSTTPACDVASAADRPHSDEPGQLGFDVVAGGRLPVLLGVGGVEQPGLGQQVGQDRRPAGPEVVVGDVGVLPADVGDVLRVAVRGCGQDGE